MELSKPQVLSFKKFFRSKCTSDSLSQNSVIEMFQQYDIPQRDFNRILTISNLSGDPQYSVIEFILVSYFVFMYKSGVSLPNEIPPNLLDTVLRLNDLTDVEESKDSKISRKKREKKGTRVRNSTNYESSPWSISRQNADLYFAKFSEGNVNGYFQPDAIRELFNPTGIAMEQLAKIWSLSDMDLDGQLSLGEFLISSHLLTNVLNGKTIPDKLPTELIETAVIMEQLYKSGSRNSIAFIPQNTFQRNTSGTLDISSFQENDIQKLMVQLNQEIIVDEMMLQSYGIDSVVLEVFDATQDINRVKSEIHSVEVAKAVLEQADPEIKALIIQIDKEKSLTEELQEKIQYSDKEAKILNVQKDQLLSQYSDLSQKIQQNEYEIKSLTENTNYCLQEIENLQIQFGNDTNISVNANQDMLNQVTQQHLILKSTYQQQSTEFLQLMSEINNLCIEQNLSPNPLPTPREFHEVDF